MSYPARRPPRCSVTRLQGITLPGSPEMLHHCKETKSRGPTAGRGEQSSPPTPGAGDDGGWRGRLSCPARPLGRERATSCKIPQGFTCGSPQQLFGALSIKTPHVPPITALDPHWLCAGPVSPRPAEPRGSASPPRQRRARIPGSATGSRSGFLPWKLSSAPGISPFLNDAFLEMWVSKCASAKFRCNL